MDVCSPKHQSEAAQRGAEGRKEESDPLRLMCERVIEASPLNVSQREAVTESLKPGLTDIWGPPGTGKTETGAMIVALKVLRQKQKQNQAERKPVLVCSETLCAVDTFALRLMKKGVRRPAISSPRSVISSTGGAGTHAESVPGKESETAKGGEWETFVPSCVRVGPESKVTVEEAMASTTRFRGLKKEQIEKEICKDPESNKDVTNEVAGLRMFATLRKAKEVVEQMMSEGKLPTVENMQTITEIFEHPNVPNLIIEFLTAEGQVLKRFRLNTR
uniref:DNA2/NAM7 helicase helicase domain-containing protein n=1 Tax=Chromera velia CCMP2878 TaxID=1169474 RepID=A0A0G4H0T3_9ALVE|eukprot:Cvel_5498.t1-p1 / transcript=Cvel_5498.t1 / gene=Cvel_5498 / organism=Chromera_velia_CCMP2878 / gene_product=ATP-dependent helicase upf1, putative / transcript_product=ATP-dependent helicase upf1, putative / location=Cvel_scaffold257:62682-65565(+) / protein_length=274 / sequence_SO=supercontig / SO=protein_coding / is_pseudo=false